MGIKRPVDVDFWDDEVVIDLFSPEDKYFMMFLLTNPKVRQVGIYKLPRKVIAFYLGYSKEAVEVLLERFEKQYKMIIYSHDTQEIALLNYLKRSILKGGKPVYDCIKKDLSMVTNKELVEIVYTNLEEYFTTSPKESTVEIGKILLDHVGTVAPAAPVERKDNECLAVFEHWNNKGIVKHQALTAEISKAIKAGLKKYKLPLLLELIDRYHTVYVDQSYYFSHTWNLATFITRKGGAADFTDEGSKWNDYKKSPGSSSGAAAPGWVAENVKHWETVDSKNKEAVNSKDLDLEAVAARFKNL